MCVLLSCSSVSSTVSSHLHTVVLLIYSGLVGLASAGGPVTVVLGRVQGQSPWSEGHKPHEANVFLAFGVSDDLMSYLPVSPQGRQSAGTRFSLTERPASCCH